MQDLNDLYYFAKVVEAGGFAAAGRLLGIPKSRLSRRIAELEDAIGQDLNAETVAGTYPRRDDDYSADAEPADISVRALPDGHVAIEGEALWIGNAETGNVNTGTLEGEFDLRGGRVAYRDGDDEWSCVLTLRFTRDAVEVHEPKSTCGGMNVRFGGHYIRR